MSTFKDLTGQRFGRLVAIKRGSGGGHKGVIKWVCSCDCGNVGSFPGVKLRDGRTQSCGCLHKEQLSLRNRTHGFARSRFYNIFFGMKKRCENKKCKSYPRYGGRGISVGWASFEEFFKDMYESYKVHVEAHGEKETTIDRIDNECGYNKKNCRWATYKEQGNNKRKHGKRKS